ncbi:MAG: stage 0 sporulation protein [Nitrospirae bacterium]|nr:stage 0 sporulation protein [Nitrospirota bacterium]
MIKVVGVKFREKGKIYHFDAENLQLKLGDDVVVETERGVGYAKVYSMPRFILKPFSGRELKKVLKKATVDDFLEIQNIRDKEKEAFRFCLEKIGERDIQMKLMDVECLQDGNKIIFYFTADGRIDFRELVKDLASKFRTRIEMRQIGVRDVARMVNGCGLCGRTLCCSSFLREFEPISIKMAKEQSIVLNPAKISGMCGRLMCCIGFEMEDRGSGRPPCARKEKIAAEAETEAVLQGEGLAVQLQELEDAEAAAPPAADEGIKTEPPEKLSAALEAAVARPESQPPQQQHQKQESPGEKRKKRRRRRKHRH